MRVVYIAKHGSGGNDDEGAIVHALEQLGHSVDCIHEDRAHRAAKRRGDLLLFHKWSDANQLMQFRDRMPRAFWYFDLVSWPYDASLENRCRQRRLWMANTLPNVEFAFCTDGDFVTEIAGHVRATVVHLTQGADERVAMRGHIAGRGPHILFPGISKGGGTVRESFVSEMHSRYGNKFVHVPARVHGNAMADLVANSRIVVAPDSPATDRYWSNRVYLMLGFGAFLLHPRCSGLAEHYTEEELVRYSTREELHSKIASFMERKEERAAIAEAGYRRTLKEHLYRHRVEQLLKVVRP